MSCTLTAQVATSTSEEETVIKKMILVGGVVLVWRELKRHDEHGHLDHFWRDAGGEVAAGFGIMLGHGLNWTYRAATATRDLLR